MSLGPVQTRRVLAALLVAGTALFAVGATAERSDGHDRPEAATEHAETEHVDEANDEANEEAHADEEAEGETIIGIDLENATTIAVAVAASLALAVLIWIRGDRRLLVVIAIFALAFGVLDIAELLHQIDEHRAGLAAIAAGVAALHAGSAAIAAIAARQASTFTPAH